MDFLRDQGVARLAARKHGVVTTARLRNLGLDRRTIAQRARRGRLHRVHRGVYTVGHPRLTFRGRCSAAVLACGEGAVVSHRAAAVLWRLLPPAQFPIDVTLSGRSGRRAQPGIAVHASTTLGGATTTRHEIPVTRPARTLKDIKRSGAQALYLQVFRRAIDRRLIEAAGVAVAIRRMLSERR